MTEITYNRRGTSTARTISFQHDWEGDESLPMAIVSTVATLLETDPTELEMLYDCIDPDALETMFQPHNGAGRDNGHVRFQFSGCEVTVYGGGFTVVRRLE